ncbi:hypothetical protein AMK15_05410 [Streptomyces sp. MJM1172]|nr:hypothetical protein AMK15_05410 [Streptomyces sp. MJM1172]
MHRRPTGPLLPGEGQAQGSVQGEGLVGRDDCVDSVGQVEIRAGQDVARVVVVMVARRLSMRRSRSAWC